MQPLIVVAYCDTKEIQIELKKLKRVKVNIQTVFVTHRSLHVKTPLIRQHITCMSIPDVPIPLTCDFRGDLAGDLGDDLGGDLLVDASDGVEMVQLRWQSCL